MARAMSVIGDRWTLLILRDTLFGVRRFDDIQKRLGITRHVLSDRLKRLEAHGLLERRQYQERPPRFEYHPTQAGKGFVPVMQAMTGWVDAHMPTDKPAPYRVLDRESRAPIAPKVIDSNTGKSITASSVWVETNKD
ncbi:helix-turn-helix domain-containing protein [Shimia sp. NS0008-38b]